MGVHPYYRRTLAPSAVLCKVCEATLLLGPVSLTGDKLHSCSLGQKTVNLLMSDPRLYQPTPWMTVIIPK